MTFEEADAAYPFDPTARAEWLNGLEKLRAFDTPAMRRNVYQLWLHAALREALRTRLAEDVRRDETAND